MKLVALLAAAVFAVPLSGCGGPDDALVAACDEAIKARLKSPFTYQQISATIVAPEAVSPEEAARGKGGEELLEIYVRAGGAFRHRAIIEYDAANSFGTPIRGTTICDNFSVNANPPDKVLADLVLVDGKTTLEWMGDALLPGA